MEQSPQQRSRSGRLGTYEGIASFGRSQMVTHGTNATDTRRDHGHLIVHASFRELFKAPELVDMQIGMLDLAIVIKMHRDARMSLNTRYWFNCYFPTHYLSLLFKRLSSKGRQKHPTCQKGNCIYQS
jgi:hypothetical protein